MVAIGHIISTDCLGCQEKVLRAVTAGGGRVSDGMMFGVLRGWDAGKVEEYYMGVLPTSGHSLTYVYPQSYPHVDK